MKKWLYLFAASPAIGVGLGLICKALRVEAGTAGPLVAYVMGGGLLIWMVLLIWGASTREFTFKTCLASLLIFVISMIFMFGMLDYIAP